MQVLKKTESFYSKKKAPSPTNAFCPSITSKIHLRGEVFNQYQNAAIF